MKKETYNKIVSLYKEGVGESTAILCILQSIIPNSTIEFREAAQIISKFYHEVVILKELDSLRLDHMLTVLPSTPEGHSKPDSKYKFLNKE